MNLLRENNMFSLDNFLQFRRPFDLQREARPIIRIVLLDIEGTTTPITFVKDTLFPYARYPLPAIRWF